MHEYQYKAWPALGLGEIRLLKLHSGDAQEELVGNLDVVKLTADHVQPQYDTLSYTWGEQGPTEVIKIIQASHQYCIRIRPNLQSALRHLRSHREDRYLWVDAICINQDDEEEKSNQVRMMSIIFNNAASVCVWVGPEEDDSRTAIDFIKTHLVRENADQLLEDHRHKREWLALSKLMRRPWFSRRWIIQEIALAKDATLHCGRSWLHWDDFADAVMLFTWGQVKIHDMIRGSWDGGPNLLGDVRESAAARLVHARDNIFRKSEKGQILDKLMSLEELLCSFSAFDASNPRDTIYAILSIARDAKPGFPGSYTTNEIDPDRFPDVTFDTMLFESPGSYLPPPESDSGVALQPMSLKKRTHSNDKDDESNGRQNKRVQTDGLTVANLEEAREARPAAETPSIRVVASSSEVDNQLPRIIDNEGERFPALNVSPVSLYSLVDEDLLSPYQATRNERNFGEGPNTIDRPLEEQIVGRLTVPQRGRGNSSASLSSNQTDIYYRQSEGIRRRQAEQCRIPVDYGKPVKEVCKDVMRYAFDKTQSLNMICRPWAPEANSLPSWITPVTKSAFGLAHNGTYTRINADPLVGNPGSSPGFYNATPNLFGRCKIDQDGKDILTVHGFVLDEIQQKAPPAYAGVIPIEWNELAGWEDTSKPPPEKFWKILVGNRDSLGQQPHKLWRRACHIAFGMKPQGGPLNVEKTSEEASSFVKEYLKMVLRTTYSRRLAISSRKFWALVPPKTKKGDKLCIINGCSVPIVLREICPSKAAVGQVVKLSKDSVARCDSQGECKCQKNGSKEKMYEMIGESYVHSMMGGEALLYQQQHGIKERAFRIR